MSMNILVFNYVIVSHKQLLIQQDAIYTNVGCHLRIIKKFLQYFFLPMK